MVQKFGCVFWFIGLALMTGCSQRIPEDQPKPQPGAEVKWEHLPDACQALKKQLEHCTDSGMSKKADVQKMSAVLLEQLGSKPVTEQSKTCQDASAFWQKACGVAK